MDGKASFVMYTDYACHWELLSGDEVKALDMAIFYYVKTGEPPEFDGMLKMAFSFIRANLDRDAAAWRDEKENRTAAAKKGAAARWGNKDSNT